MALSARKVGDDVNRNGGDFLRGEGFWFLRLHLFFMWKRVFVFGELQFSYMDFSAILRCAFAYVFTQTIMEYYCLEYNWLPLPWPFHYS